ncbi:MAG: hypothetical protein KF773_33470 [Deltaproteobacteria bacterium]|nr:hypothetical protein [Deltaproteobacteria bacterium]MCW5807620.1 hypothetical protein [Deltaproteobacteria bacterium]
MAAELQAVFEVLVPILSPCARHLALSREYSYDTSTHYALWEDAPGTTTMFGAVVMKRRKVSFYLYALALYRDLRGSIGKPLLPRFVPRGSFFDFDRIDPPALAALGDLVEVSLERWLLERSR